MRNLLLLAIGGLLTACAISQEQQALSVSQCSEALTQRPAAEASIDAQGFGLLNWNIQKARNASWADTLDAFAQDTDLYLLQEAAPRFGQQSTALAKAESEFAEGFGIGTAKTGVMTAGHPRATAACRLTAREPVFGTPKATLVTRYEINGLDTSLLVINMHGINFSLGIGALETQLAIVSDLLTAHDGPAILSGDFNTWRHSRHELLVRYASIAGMQPVAFDTDHRKTVFGWPLDHVFVRGLEVLSATSLETDSSDHNPVHARFSVVGM